MKINSVRTLIIAGFFISILILIGLFLTSILKKDLQTHYSIEAKMGTPFELIDSNGNKIESIGYYIYPNKEPIIGYQFKYEYNEFGNKIKDVEVIGKYRRLRFDKYKTEVTEYDKFQNIKLEEYLTESGTTLKVVVNNYEYDNFGNWIKKETKEGTNHENLEIIEITKREIQYNK